MEYLTDKKHQYAAKILELGFHGNVESALNEAEEWANGKTCTLTEDYDRYYLVHDTGWKWPYIVKKIPLSRIIRGESYVFATEDDNVKRFRW